MELAGQKVFLAEIQENNYETEPWTVGIYSTREKAERAILEELKELNFNVSSLKEYDEIRNNLKCIDYDYSILEMYIE